MADMLLCTCCAPVPNAICHAVNIIVLWNISLRSQIWKNSRGPGRSPVMYVCKYICMCRHCLRPHRCHSVEVRTWKSYETCMKHTYELDKHMKPSWKHNTGLANSAPTHTPLIRFDSHWRGCVCFRALWSFVSLGLGLCQLESNFRDMKRLWHKVVPGSRYHPAPNQPKT